MLNFLRRLFGIRDADAEFYRGYEHGFRGGRASTGDIRPEDYLNPLDEVYPQLDEYIESLLLRAQLYDRGYVLVDSLEDDEDDTANFDLEEGELDA